METMADVTKAAKRAGFSIAIICAIREERDAVMEMLDDKWDESEYDKVPGDDNTYNMGLIGRHKVVVVRLPGMGPREAANSAASFRISFPNITLGLVVGICGGIPKETESGPVMMGDVILSKEIFDFTHAGQYDNSTRPKDTIADRFGRPNREIRGFLATLEGKRDREALKDQTSDYLVEFCDKKGFQSWNFPGADKDVAYPRNYRHKHQQGQSSEVCAGDVCAKCRVAEDELSKAKTDKKTKEEIETAEAQVKNAKVCEMSIKQGCEKLGCDTKEALSRDSDGKYPRHTRIVNGKDMREPEIHFGTIGSGSSVMKSGYMRDELAEERGFIAFEMEGAGVWDNFPTVVIKAVCDYADSHKRKEWQKYASGCAAACMKAFLMKWAVVDDPSHLNATG